MLFHNTLLCIAYFAQISLSTKLREKGVVLCHLRPEKLISAVVVITNSWEKLNFECCRDYLCDTVLLLEQTLKEGQKYDEILGHEII